VIIADQFLVDAVVALAKELVAAAARIATGVASTGGEPPRFAAFPILTSPRKLAFSCRQRRHAKHRALLIRAQAPAGAVDKLFHPSSSRDELAKIRFGRGAAS
jgi:hypothetical protein